MRSGGASRQPYLSPSYTCDLQLINLFSGIDEPFLIRSDAPGRVEWQVVGPCHNRAWQGRETVALLGEGLQPHQIPFGEGLRPRRSWPYSEPTARDFELPATGDDSEPGCFWGPPRVRRMKSSCSLL